MLSLVEVKHLRSDVKKSLVGGGQFRSISSLTPQARKVLRRRINERRDFRLQHNNGTKLEEKGPYLPDTDMTPHGKRIDLIRNVYGSNRNVPINQVRIPKNADSFVSRIRHLKTVEALRENADFSRKLAAKPTRPSNNPKLKNVRFSEDMPLSSQAEVEERLLKGPRRARKRPLTVVNRGARLEDAAIGLQGQVLDDWGKKMLTLPMGRGDKSVIDHEIQHLNRKRKSYHQRVYSQRSDRRLSTLSQREEARADVLSTPKGKKPDSSYEKIFSNFGKNPNNPYSNMRRNLQGKNLSAPKEPKVNTPTSPEERRFKNDANRFLIQSAVPAAAVTGGVGVLAANSKPKSEKKPQTSAVKKMQDFEAGDGKHVYTREGYITNPNYGKVRQPARKGFLGIGKRPAVTDRREALDVVWAKRRIQRKNGATDWSGPVSMHRESDLESPYTGDFVSRGKTKGLVALKNRRKKD